MTAACANVRPIIIALKEMIDKSGKLAGITMANSFPAGDLKLK